jgi:transcriptional regulator with XRE-family HTH domain
MLPGMGSRERRVDVGAANAREILARLPAEARALRLGSGLTQAIVAAALGLSRSQYSRIERGLSSDLSIATACRMYAVLGQRLAIKGYPDGDPIRDAAHAALLERLHRQCHRSLTWRTEVPLPLPGDLRAWDATIGATAFGAGVEAETRFRDQQALDRRLGRKERDGGLDLLILLLLDSRSNRAAMRDHIDWVRQRFPVPGLRALEALAAGMSPGGNTVILL